MSQKLLDSFSNWSKLRAFDSIHLSLGTIILICNLFRFIEWKEINMHNATTIIGHLFDLLYIHFSVYCDIVLVF